MVDIVGPEVRSRMMSGIRGTNTRPEVFVRRALFAGGYRFRLHRRDLPGAPDIVLPGRRVALFVHGCFWHMHAGCKYSRLPATRPDFWRTKLEGNMARDRHAVEALLGDGWRVLTVWECATRGTGSMDALSAALSAWIESSHRSGELSGAQPP